MHVKSLFQSLNVDAAQPGLKPGTSWSRSQVSTTRPQDHDDDDHDDGVAIISF